MSIPITPGSGATSVAAESVSGLQYQQIQVLGPGGSSTLSISPDGSANVSVVGTISANVAGSVAAFISGTPSISGAVTVVGATIPPGSVSGTVGSSVIGSVPIQLSNSSIITVSKDSSVIGIVTGSILAQGTQTAGAAASARPLQIGGVDSDGSVVSARFARDGDLITHQHSSVVSFTDDVSNQISTQVASDGITFVVEPTYGYMFDGTTWDRIRGNSTNGQLVQSGNASVITTQQGSVGAVIIGGSIAASVTPAANQSVSGTVQTDVRGSVATVIIGGSIAASFTPPANQSVSGTVQVDVRSSVATVIIGGSIATASQPTSGSSVVQQGTWITSVISATPSSMLAGASIFGQLPAGTAPLGSIATLQGTNPWLVNNIGNGSVISVSVGSVISVLRAPSIVGTYAEDSGHTTGSSGLFVMQVRNDTMASITSADGDYSPIAGGPVGETIVSNSPITNWISGTADLRVSSGGSIAVISPQGASVFTYITGVQVANMGSASVLVTLSGGTSSIVGYTIAPAGGGSNIVYPNALKTRQNAAFAASISGAASVLVSAQGFTARI